MMVLVNVATPVEDRRTGRAIAARVASLAYCDDTLAVQELTRTTSLPIIGGPRTEVACMFWHVPECRTIR